MTPPVTNFEATGEWTTLAQERAFLTQVVADTALTEIVAGYSAASRPIYYYTLGTGPNTLMLVALVHGDEPAPRDALLAMMRDMAYSTDPATAAYLAAHTIVFVPNATPDVTLLRRAYGADPNRDRFSLLTHEAQALAHIINETQPRCIVDAHEYFAAGADWQGFPSMMPGSHPAVAALEQDIFEAGLDLMWGMGYTAKLYPPTWIPRGCTSSYGNVRGIVSLTSETNFQNGDPPVRVDVQRSFFEMVIEWFGQNAQQCEDAYQASLEWARTSFDPDILAIRTEHVLRDTPEVVYLDGYQLAEPLSQYLMDVHGIEVGEDGFVSIFQDARRIIPQILDPAAMDRQVEAVRVLRISPEPPAPSEPLPQRPLLGCRVRINGRTRDVTGIRVRINGRTRDVIMPGQ